MDVVAVILIVLGGLALVLPWLAILQKTIRRDPRAVSFVPLLSPILCAIGFALLGAPGWLYLVPLLLDAGTVGMVFGLVTSLRSRSRSS